MTNKPEQPENRISRYRDIMTDLFGAEEYQQMEWLNVVVEELFDLETRFGIKSREYKTQLNKVKEELYRMISETFSKDPQFNELQVIIGDMRETEKSDDLLDVMGIVEFFLKMKRT